MPADFPPWDRVYAFFRRWRDHALVREFHDRLRTRVRERLGRDAEPTAGVIDSQSIKADAVVGSDSQGFDGGKLINGRKRHVVVDTLGLLLGVMVTSADTGDRAAAQVLLKQVAGAHHRLTLVWADAGYTAASSSTAWPLSRWSWRSSSAATTCAASWCCPSGGSSSASSPT
ncbi:transposase [Streptomyces sp. NBC_00210]|uniref:transposase n=1 Tax=Streptomyces sp. NBC_00210 TaxID=2903636 RepID=UPI003244658D